MNETVEEALRRWGAEGAAYNLAAKRENAVYRVTGPRGKMALRLHRVGYRSDEELRSELNWMAAVARAGVSVPAPISSSDGETMKVIEGVQIDALTWLDGATMEEALETGDAERRHALFYALGREMAKFHDASDAWSPPNGFTRVRWNLEGLLGDAPVWGRFWENPELSAEDEALALRFRDVATSHLNEISASIDAGLIHADLVPSNVIVDGDRLHLIDFDDGGHGHRLFDVATALSKQTEASDYPDLKVALIEGYSSARRLDFTALDLFLALRAATYVGWNIERMDEDGDAVRNERFIRSMRALINRYFDA